MVNVINIIPAEQHSLQLKAQGPASVYRLRAANVAVDFVCFSNYQGQE